MDTRFKYAPGDVVRIRESAETGLGGLRARIERQLTLAADVHGSLIYDLTVLDTALMPDYHEGDETLWYFWEDEIEDVV